MNRRKTETLDTQGVEFLIKYKKRQTVLDAYINQSITRKDAIKKIDVSKSQFKKILKRYKQHGFVGLLHQSINKPSHNAIVNERKQQVLALYKTKYPEFNYVHASEKMAELDNVIVHHATLRNWLLEAKITKPKHKHKAYYKKREPEPCFNDLVQVDGSFHDWFGDGNMHCLMHLVDDSTKTSLAMIFNGETTISALTILKLWCEKYGIPKKLYMDRDSVYKINDKHAVATIEEELRGFDKARTEFAKVCDKLGIQLIYAHTPQAKGRVERKHGLYQDRLVKELRMLGIKTIASANNYILEPGGFLENINAKFTIAPKRNSASLRLTPAELTEIFTIDDSRIVNNDYTIHFKNVVYQLLRPCKVNAKTKVTVKTYIDGKIAICFGKHKLKYKKLDNYTKPRGKRKLQASPYLINFIRNKMGRSSKANASQNYLDM
jgi:transposase